MKFAGNLRDKGWMSDEEFKQVMALWNKCLKKIS